MLIQLKFKIYCKTDSNSFIMWNLTKALMHGVWPKHTQPRGRRILMFTNFELTEIWIPPSFKPKNHNLSLIVCITHTFSLVNSHFFPRSRASSLPKPNIYYNLINTRKERVRTKGKGNSKIINYKRYFQQNNKPSLNVQLYKDLIF